MNPNLSKETIYIDVDDEITTIIDKVISSKSKVVALVLPKRATVFQSVVNMKLLKKKAESAKKNIVLVTTETSLLPLAGAVGVFVAKTLASKPEIPMTIAEPSFEVIDNSEGEAIRLDNSSKGSQKPNLEKSIGELDDETKGKNDLDNAIDAISADELKDDQKPSRKDARKNKKSEKNKKVPDFNRFKKNALFIGIALVILVFGIWLLFSVLPSVTITIQTNAQSVNTNVHLTLSQTANSLNQSNNTVPAKQVNESKNYSSTVNATGQTNYGLKASGSVLFTEKVCGVVASPTPIPPGTGISQSGLSYITQGQATNFSNNGSVDGNCITYKAVNDTSVTAQNGGTKYNTASGTTFTNPSDSNITAIATSSIDGGTDNIVTIVSQADITNATNKLTQNNTQAKQDLVSQIQQLNYYPIQATFQSSNFNPTPSVAAGTQANSVTVTANVNYTMYGARESDLNTLLTTNINSQVNNQHILDTGLSNATFSTANGSTEVTQLIMQSTAEVGPSIDVNNIKSQVVGQKAGTITSIIEQNPNVTKVTVKFSPFYVNSAPSKQSKITINVSKPVNKAQ